MHRKNKKTQWKLWLTGVGAAACLIIPLTAPAHADDMDAHHHHHHMMKDHMGEANPVQISGTVEKYYTDRSGLVTALDLSNTAGNVQKVRFAPSWARRLLDNNPVGSTLDAWVVAGHDDGMDVSDLVSIGIDRPDRFLTDDFHTGTERLNSRAWVWRDAAYESVTGGLRKIIVSEKGEVLALVLDDGTLVRVPRTVKNQEQGAHGSAGVAELFRGAEVTAWGPQVWGARGDVSIYGQRIASDGLSINGKTVSAIGIQDFNAYSSPLLGSAFSIIVGNDGEYTPFEASMEKHAPPPTLMSEEDKMHMHDEMRMRHYKQHMHDDMDDMSNSYYKQREDIDDD